MTKDYLAKLVLVIVAMGIPAGPQTLVGDRIQVLPFNVWAVPGASHGVLGKTVC